MPDNHILYLPVLFHFAPNCTDVLPVFVHDDMEVILGYFGDIVHPQLCKVIWQDISLEVLAVALSAEALDGFTIFLFTFEVVEDVGRICEAFLNQ